MTTTYPTPENLSPSRVEQFTSCPLAFRFNSLDKIPSPPAPYTTRGSLVHRALEIAFTRPPAERVPDVFRASLEAARAEFAEEVDSFGMTPEQVATFDAECVSLVERYLTMEDPTQVHPIGLELRLSAAVGSLSLRGIIDRLELRGDDMVVTDYKTGRSPSPNWEQKSLAGVHFYSFLCEEFLGRRPDVIRLMYLKTAETIELRPTERSVRFVTMRVSAVWKAIERACTTGDFRAKPSALCRSCAYQEICPAQMAS